jgi:hypothetical protein
MRRAAVSVCALAALVFAPVSSAHKGITSKFTYNADVYPVFLNRCGRCHIDGGVGPMSLLKYEDAFPWAESIRTELMAAYPDSSVNPSADLSADLSAEARGAKAEARNAKVEARSTKAEVRRVKGDSADAKVDLHDFVRAAHRQISARELDIVLEWTTGGTPEGDKANTPSPPAFKNDWAGGKPSLTIALTKYDMPASTFEANQEFVMPISASPVSVAQLDLLPGNPAIVRSAAISLRSSDGTTRLVGTWFPRQTAGPIALKPPVRIEPGSSIVALIHYKKTWKFEGEAMADQSTIGLYTSD